MPAEQPFPCVSMIDGTIGVTCGEGLVIGCLGLKKPFEVSKFSRFGPSHPLIQKSQLYEQEAEYFSLQSYPEKINAT